ncbi:LacI family DNA-binding transcriptional regulator [Rathayibacter sp. VKM Ac-2835]|uniref:LacI family DNA-binding transcriptional regulator n=1 Tax=unclassified Rathayibacter TaxID=2609250 RepID=UPI0010DECC59|nr:LacI family DNA-binding transcriptional regulator [Rathayibacter sp. PhB151]NRG43070.1 LacI family DNA-binding transcriptional regulator [Rathayibacter sp. VKM Ac-2835]TDX74939.1 LacI family transcriptional regulator [Rathayibacter sp. PhB151]
MPDGPRRPRRGGSPTIYDIADAVGVSASSVSRALTTPGRLSAELEGRIRAAATQMGYRSNPAARALPTGRSGAIGLVLPDLTDPLSLGLIAAAEAAAASAGRHLIVADAQRAPGPRTTLELADATGGLVLFDSLLSDGEIQGLAATHETVSVAREVAQVRSLIPDYTPGIDGAFDHLLRLGHRSIAYLTTSSGSRMRGAAAEAITTRAADRGIPLEVVSVTHGHLDGTLARLHAAEISAVITQDGILALAIAEAVRKWGAVVPDSLSVIGIDDLHVSPLTSPAMSSIRLPLPELITRAVRSVLTPADLPAGSPLSTQYIPRDSVGRHSPTSPERALVHATVA